MYIYIYRTTQFLDLNEHLLPSFIFQSTNLRIVCPKPLCPTLWNTMKLFMAQSGNPNNQLWFKLTTGQLKTYNSTATWILFAFSCGKRHELHVEVDIMKLRCKYWTSFMLCDLRLGYYTLLQSYWPYRRTSTSLLYNIILLWHYGTLHSIIHNTIPAGFVDCYQS